MVYTKLLAWYTLCFQHESVQVQVSVWTCCTRLLVLTVVSYCQVFHFNPPTRSTVERTLHRLHHQAQPISNWLSSQKRSGLAVSLFWAKGRLVYCSCRALKVILLECTAVCTTLTLSRCLWWVCLVMLASVQHWHSNTTITERLGLSPDLVHMHGFSLIAVQCTVQYLHWFDFSIPVPIMFTKTRPSAQHIFQVSGFHCSKTKNAIERVMPIIDKLQCNVTWMRPYSKIHDQWTFTSIVPFNPNSITLCACVCVECVLITPDLNTNWMQAPPPPPLHKNLFAPLLRRNAKQQQKKRVEQFGNMHCSAVLPYPNNNNKKHTIRSTVVCYYARYCLTNAIHIDTSSRTKSNSISFIRNVTNTMKMNWTTVQKPSLDQHCLRKGNAIDTKCFYPIQMVSGTLYFRTVSKWENNRPNHIVA